MKQWLETAAQHHREGRLDEASVICQQIVSNDPSNLAAHVLLGECYKDMGKMPKAETCFRKVVSLAPSDSQSHYNLAMLLVELGRIEDAQQSFERAISLSPDFSQAYIGLGALHYAAGRIAEANACFAKAPEIDPPYWQMDSHKLFAMHYDPSVSMQKLYDAAVAWGRRYAPASSMNPPQQIQLDTQRRLNIGYVSADFRNHPVAKFMETVLALHDPSQVEIFCYAGNPYDDPDTRRIKSCVQNWRRTYTLSDAELEQLIRKDQIDILVDLTGHTSGNRLMVFAKKPAPIQITWIGYFDTTGMEAMDYILCDDRVLPAGQERWFVEKPLRLDPSYLCFTPPPYAVEPGELPLQHNGYVTFASFTRMNKLNPDVLKAWADILRRVPRSRLLLKSGSLGNEQIATGLRSFFVSHGIEAERLIFEGLSKYRDYISRYQQVDIVLDTFPYGGGTTTAEALWMGVPVVTWPQERFIGRLSTSLLHSVGADELIADSYDSYIHLVVSLSQEVEALAAYRKTLRKRLLSSPAGNAALFVPQLEASYRKAWLEYCNNAGT